MFLRFVLVDESYGPAMIRWEGKNEVFNAEVGGSGVGPLTNPTLQTGDGPPKPSNACSFFYRVHVPVEDIIEDGLRTLPHLVIYKVAVGNQPTSGVSTELYTAAGASGPGLNRPTSPSSLSSSVRELGDTRTRRRTRTEGRKKKDEEL